MWFECKYQHNFCNFFPNAFCLLNCWLNFQYYIIFNLSISSNNVEGSYWTFLSGPQRDQQGYCDKNIMYYFFWYNRRKCQYEKESFNLHLNLRRPKSCGQIFFLYLQLCFLVVFLLHLHLASSTSKDMYCRCLQLNLLLVTIS